MDDALENGDPVLPRADKHMNLRQHIVFRRGGAESYPYNQPRFHLPLSTQWRGGWGVRLLALSLLLANCSGLAGEPQIVSTLPPATATPALTPPTALPDIALGAQVFADNCTRCHGASGKGDGELVQSEQVPSPGDFTNPTTSGAQPPLGYYSVITNGNLDKLMPPWADALNQQERWSVALYTYTLSITPDQIGRGRDLFNADCADCDVSALTSLDATANLSRDKLIAAVGDLPGFASLSDSERADAAVYVRSLALANPDAIGSIAAAATAEASGTEEPSAASTMEPAAAVGMVSGQVTNGSAGSTVPADLPLTLFIFDADFNQQQFTTTTDATDAYSFSDMPLDASYQYVVTANYRDHVFASDVLSGDALSSDIADGSLNLPLTIYELTEDADVIQLAGLVTQVSVSSGSLEIAQVYNFTNTSDRAYTTSQTTDDGRAISLAITLPPGAMIAGFPSDQNRFVVDATNETFYDTVPVLPGEQHIIQVIYLIQYDQGAIIEQPINYAISAPVRLLLTPQNIGVTSDQLQPLGAQTLGSTQYESYGAELSLPMGSVLRYELSGTGDANPAQAAVSSSSPTLLIGGAVVIVLLIGGSVYLIARRNRSGDEQVKNILIRQIAELDAEHEAGKIDDESYEQQRAALKARLAALLERDP